MKAPASQITAETGKKPAKVRSSYLTPDRLSNGQKKRVTDTEVVS